jgi:hypothetical protein
VVACGRIQSHRSRQNGRHRASDGPPLAIWGDASSLSQSRQRKCLQAPQAKEQTDQIKIQPPNELPAVAEGDGFASCLLAAEDEPIDIVFGHGHPAPSAVASFSG